MSVIGHCISSLQPPNLIQMTLNGIFSQLEWPLELIWWLIFVTNIILYIDIWSLSHWVIDWSFYFTPTSPKLDSNGSEWHLFPAWMTIGACLMAHIRDKYHNWHQNMVIESLSHWVIDWVFYFTPATPKLDWSWRHDFDWVPGYVQDPITAKQYI